MTPEQIEKLAREEEIEQLASKTCIFGLPNEAIAFKVGFIGGYDAGSSCREGEIQELKKELEKIYESEKMAAKLIRWLPPAEIEVIKNRIKQLEQ